jgi:predicted alpha/beta-hydrolase family hydrolase
MVKRRETGTRRPPDRELNLRETWLEIIESLDTDKLIIGGKSMGGRIASLIADETEVAGLVCLGYPFHSPGKPDKLRIEHLKAIKTPTLIVQGERDALGNKDEVTGYRLSKNIQFHWIPDGDHSFKPRKLSGRTKEDNWNDAIRVTSVAQIGAVCAKLLHVTGQSTHRRTATESPQYSSLLRHAEERRVDDTDLHSVGS